MTSIFLVIGGIGLALLVLSLLLGDVFDLGMHAGGPFSLADAGDLERRVRAAGFDDVTVDVVRKHRHYRDAAHQVEEIGTLSPQLAEAFDRAADTVGAWVDEYRPVPA